MRRRRIIAGVLGIVFAAQLGLSETKGASFQNLGFEEGNWFGSPFPRSGPYVPQLLFPGWTVSHSDGGMTYDGPYPIFGLTVLMDAHIRDFEEFSTTPIMGQYAFGVSPNAYYPALGSEAPPTTLEQRGLIPSDAYFLQFIYQGEILRLEVDGKDVPILALGPRPSGDSMVPEYSWYGADIHDYAGKEATLSFKFFAFQKHVEADWPGRLQTLDGIAFLPVPEPGSAGLLLVGLGAVAAGRIRRC